jgi:VanZ family protein
MAGTRPRRFVTHWLPLILWAGAVFALSSQPVMPHVGPKLNETEYLFDYVAHAAEFGLLCGLAWRAFCVSAAAWLSRRPALAAWAFSALYAALDEAHQALVPGRMATLSDWLVDVAGAALMSAGVSLWARRWRMRRRDVRVEAPR